MTTRVFVETRSQVDFFKVYKEKRILIGTVS